MKESWALSQPKNLNMTLPTKLAAAPNCSSGNGRAVTDHTEAAFDVDEIEREVGELKERGVQFESYDMPGLKTDENNIAAMNGAKSAWFKDTEGNIIAIVQM